MFIENTKQFDNFINSYTDKEAIIIPIFESNKNYNKLSFIFIKILNEDKYFIINKNHNELLKYEVDLDILKNNKFKFVPDKKRFNEIGIFDNIIDIGMLYFFKYGKRNEQLEKTYDFKNNIYSSFPIYKFCELLIEYSKLLNDIIIDCDELLDKEYFYKYNNLYIDTFYNIEKNGISTDIEKLKQYYNKNKHIVYSNYNLYNYTSRPTNSNDGINFAALNKTDGSRSSFVSRFGNEGLLFVFDYDAFHIRLAAKLLDYKLPKTSAHEFFGKQFFNKDELTKEEYEEAKIINFKLINGYIDDNISESFEYFKLIKEFVNNLWVESNEKGYFETVIFKRPVYLKYINNISKAKIFNYLLQNYETEFMVIIINELLHLMNSLQSKIILYLYDSIVIDIHKDEFKIIKEITNILEQNDFPVKISYGKNLDNLKKLTFK